MMETPTQNPSNGGGAMMNMDQAANILNWNPSNLDIKSKSVEKTLEPLVLQVRESEIYFFGNYLKT